MAEVQCVVCNKRFNVVPARLKTAKFCSYKCAGEWRKTAYLGVGSPTYKGGKMVACNYCGKEYYRIPSQEGIRKFCSKLCADKGGFRYTGKDHPNYRENSRRKRRNGSHHKWANAVISRDSGICQHCGATGIELHAHHIKSYKDHPELRFDVTNGITLCHKCHWALHAALNAKAVNSGNTLTVHAEGNPEPSIQGNLIEGVTTRGRAYRRFVGNCSWCGSVVCRRLSDIKPSRKLFCNKHCSGKYLAANRTYRRWKNPVMAVIASTNAAPERDEIV